MSFVERHGLWTGEQARAAKAAAQAIKKHKLELVRFSFADQHGVLRGKTVVAEDAPGLMQAGVTMTTTLLAKDTAHKTAFPVFTPGGGFDMAEMQGAGDFVMVADPATFQVLPWAPNTGWFLCDMFFPNGKPVPFSTRQILRDALARLKTAGFDYLAGLEVEFHLFKLENPRLTPEDATWPPRAPEVSLLNQGYQYLTESRFDQIDAALEPIRRGITALGMPLRSVEVELGPSQCEFTFRPQTGLDAADTMILFRAATKQIARRHGFLASFMCRPAQPNLFSSGWHLHQSLLERKRGSNAFAGNAREGPLRNGPAFPRRPLDPRPRRRRVLHADHQRLQALPRLYARPRPRHLGARQSRRHGARARPTRRSGNAPGKPHRRAGGEPVSLHGVADLRRPRRHGAKARSRPFGGYAVRDQGAAVAEGPRRSAGGAAGERDVSEKRSAKASSTITPTSKKPSWRASRPRPAAAAK